MAVFKRLKWFAFSFLFICAVYLLASSDGAEASDSNYRLTYLKFGGAVMDVAFRDSKIFGIGRQMGFGDFLIVQGEAGLWTDNRGGQGMSNSAYASLSAGVELEYSYVYAQAMFGGTLITSPDKTLGGHFQFNETLTVGIKDSRNVRWGLSYTHYSSAGLSEPNHGRDFAVVNVGIPF